MGNAAGSKLERPGFAGVRRSTHQPVHERNSAVSAGSAVGGLLKPLTREPDLDDHAVWYTAGFTARACVPIRLEIHVAGQPFIDPYAEQ